MARTLTQALADSRLDPVDARALMRYVLGVNDAHLITHAREPLLNPQNDLFSTLVGRRKAGEPVAYITGKREFFSLSFEVTPAVLIPRPETELLVELALEHIEPERPASVLDLGTGSGCIAISIARQREQARVVAVDASLAALAVARNNAQYHGVSNIELLQSDWFSSLSGRCFDLIVSNPPYVATGDAHLAGELRFEPQVALVAGADGLDCIRTIVATARRYLNPGGRLAFEHGYNQSARCRELLAGAGFREVFSRPDLAGIERLSEGQLDARP